jgi:hypothetical protein
MGSPQRVRAQTHCKKGTWQVRGGFTGQSLPCAEKAALCAAEIPSDYMFRIAVRCCWWLAVCVLAEAVDLCDGCGTRRFSINPPVLPSLVGPSGAACAFVWRLCGPFVALRDAVHHPLGSSQAVPDQNLGTRARRTRRVHSFKMVAVACR